MSAIQSIIFNKNTYTTKKASKWLKYHGYKPIKRVHKTTDSLRYRMINPNNFNRFITLNIEEDIKFIVGFQ